MNKEKKDVVKCDADLNCKATASLNKEIQEELTAEDKSLEEILENEDKE